MTVSFDNAESALVTQLRTLSYLDSDNCKAGETDECFRHILDTGEKYVCVTDFDGASSAGRGTWVNLVQVMFAIKIENDVQIEGDLRSVLEDLYDLMLPENDLGGEGDARIKNIQAPIAYKRNDIPFLYLLCTVEILQRVSRC
jgi:hypothetical protein